MRNDLLTLDEAAATLGVSSYSLGALVEDGRVPHSFVRLTEARDPVLRFNPVYITDWLTEKRELSVMDRKKYLERLKQRFLTRFPEAMRALRAFDRQFSPPNKYYYLIKVKNKKQGFLYYVRYYDQGRQIPSKWSTRTNDLEAAKLFAVANRERLLNKYYGKNKGAIDLYGILRGYYKKDSKYLEIDGKRNGAIGDHQRRVADNFIEKVFIPHLKKNKIKTYEGIAPPVLTGLQNKLLLEGLKPQTVNSYFTPLRRIFDHLVITGEVAKNVFNEVKNIKVRKEDRKTHGCYDIESLKGVFNEEWADKRSYILSLVIYTTNMRNCEIEKIRLKDLVEIEGVYFINVDTSKTENGRRLAPLHGFVYEKIKAYAAASGKRPDEPIFLFGKRKNQSPVYKQAYRELGKRLGFNEKGLLEQNIKYYSGRHFWKTLMNGEGLGDIDEYFMGHQVTSDIKKRYNHKDKQGRRKMIEKARRVFEILDERLF